MRKLAIVAFVILTSCSQSVSDKSAEKRKAEKFSDSLEFATDTAQLKREYVINKQEFILSLMKVGISEEEALSKAGFIDTGYHDMVNRRIRLYEATKEISER